MVLRWMTAFIDRSADDFADTARFWAAITGTTLSEARGSDGEFASLEPASGDSYLRVQRVVSGGGHHLDLHVGDVMPTVARAEELGASVEHEHGGVPVMRSPAGLPFCVVADPGVAGVPEPVSLEPGGPRSIADQLCIDVPAEHYDDECRFWTEFTGWKHRRSKRSEFSALERAETMPLQLLLQRLDDDSSAVVASAHLDFACDDVEALVPVHERLGATLVAEFEWWTVLSDPAGYRYCLTRRPPRAARPA